MWQYESRSRVTPAIADAESSIREFVQNFTTDFNTGNFDHAAGIFVPEGHLMITHREAIQGQRAIERALRELADKGYQNLRLKTVRTDVSGDRAMEIGRYTVQVRLAEGKLAEDHGNYVAFWRRLGAWRIVAQCFSTSVPRNWEDAHERVHTLERSEVISHDVKRPA